MSSAFSVYQLSTHLLPVSAKKFSRGLTQNLESTSVARSPPRPLSGSGNHNISLRILRCIWLSPVVVTRTVAPNVARDALLTTVRVARVAIGRTSYRTYTGELMKATQWKALHVRIEGAARPGRSRLLMSLILLHLARKQSFVIVLPCKGDLDVRKHV
jgi:hypothetical protein